ncbi:MAG TPA: sulfate ABC transporter permease subunit CysW [Gammaproteobacteria bacterium]|jgi:sulfate transport system permease protein
MNTQAFHFNPLRAALLGVVVLFLALFLVAPLCVVFGEALARGFGSYLAALTDPAARSAIWLTLITAAVVIPLNLVFGIAAAWCIAKFSFPGKTLLTSLIDLPFAISPVIAGLVFVLVFGRNGWLGSWLTDRGWHVIFAWPGIVLATTFVTLPFIARELIPYMQEQGRDEEEAARLMGANGWQILFRVTLPRAKLALLYGIVLCNARAMGEFGAVSVVSGHVRGQTNTLPLHVEVLYNEYDFSAAFAVASLLTLLALVTLVLKTWLERQGATATRAH